MLTFYDFGGGAGIFGTLLSLSSNQGSMPAAIAWATEDYDVTGWFDAGAPTRATVPVGVALIRVHTGLQRSTLGAMVSTQNLDGADFRGEGRAVGLQQCCATSAIVAVTAGQYVTAIASAGSVVASGRSYMAVEKIDATLKRALAYKTGTQALTATVTATLSFDAEVYDTDTFHDNSTNNSRMTAPADGYYRVGANMGLTASSGAMTRLWIAKDGAVTTQGLGLADCDDGNGELNVWTAPLFFTAGQYAEAQALCLNARTVSAGEQTWLAMESVPSTSKIALVYKSANQTLAAATETMLIWPSESYDADNMHPLAATVTITIASPGVVTWTGHNFLAGSPVVFTTTGALPTGLTAGTTYFVVNPAANTFQVSATVGGAAINTTGSQSGVHTGTNTSRLTVPAGCTRARLQANVIGPSGAGTVSIYARKNGGDFPGAAAMSCDNGSSGGNTKLWTPWVDVVPGDYFEVAGLIGSGVVMSANARTWMSLECQ